MALISSFHLPFDRSFTRRAATRMAASVAVMSALSAVSHDEARDAAPFRPLTRAAPEQSPDEIFRQAVASDPANAKSDRLQRVVAQRSPAVVPARAETEDTRDVVLFDQCRPSCESRDPLLWGRATGAVETTPEAPLLHAASYEPELLAPGPVPARSDGIRSAVASGLSVAAQSGRTILGAATRLLP